jgi:hypothetical protein
MHILSGEHRCLDPPVIRSRCIRGHDVAPVALSTCNRGGISILSTLPDCLRDIPLRRFARPCTCPPGGSQPKPQPRMSLSIQQTISSSSTPSCIMKAPASSGYLIAIPTPPLVSRTNSMFGGSHPQCYNNEAPKRSNER